MFEIWVLLLFIKFFLLSLLMGTMTCFQDNPFVVILMQGLGLGLLFPLIIFWMLLMFFAFKDGKASFIFKTFLVLLLILKACAYDLFLPLLFLVGVIGLKYLDISFTFFSDFARIREEILLILVGLLVFFFSFLLFFSRITLEVNLEAIFFLRLLLRSSAINKSYSEL